MQKKHSNKHTKRGRNKTHTQTNTKIHFCVLSHFVWDFYESNFVNCVNQKKKNVVISDLAKINEITVHFIICILRTLFLDAVKIKRKTSSDEPKCTFRGTYTLVLSLNFRVRNDFWMSYIFLSPFFCFFLSKYHNLIIQFMHIIICDISFYKLQYYTFLSKN